MTGSPAPLYDDVAGGPPGGSALWLTCSDGVRIRVGFWRPEAAAHGTVLLFPGRTEYIEKYGPAAADLAERGFAMLAIDWRGQGVADRVTDDPQVGHVAHFPDYQRDVAAALETAVQLDLPRPFHLLAHSMGGCIGPARPDRGAAGGQRRLFRPDVGHLPARGAAPGRLCRGLSRPAAGARGPADAHHRAAELRGKAGFRGQRADDRPRDVPDDAAPVGRPPRAWHRRSDPCAGCTRP